MITKRTIYFTMVHHPTRGTIRAGNACMTRKAAQQWLPMKTTRNSPRARKEIALARAMRSATRAANSSHSHGQWSSTHRHNLDATRFARALDRLNNRFHGFLTKKGFKAWDELSHR